MRNYKEGLNRYFDSSTDNTTKISLLYNPMKILNEAYDIKNEEWIHGAANALDDNMLKYLTHCDFEIRKN